MGKSGWLTCSRLSVSALESEDALILAGVTDDREPLDEAACRRFFDLPGQPERQPRVCPATCPVAARPRQPPAARPSSLRTWPRKNGHWFDTEMDKLDRWAEDRRAALKAELEELDQAIKETKKSARLAPNLPEKLERQRKLRGLETKRDEAWRAYDTGQPGHRPAEGCSARRNQPAAGAENRVQDVVHVAMEGCMSQAPKSKKPRSLTVPSSPPVVTESDFDVVLALIEAARTRAVTAANTTLIGLYWKIGEYISGKVAEEEWGRGTVEALAVYIQRRRPGASGFSASNLWRMRQFFETYSGQPKLAPLVRELSWTHNLLIMSRCKRDEEREFYLRLCQREKWGKRELERQLAGASLNEQSCLHQNSHQRCENCTPTPPRSSRTPI